MSGCETGGSDGVRDWGLPCDTWVSGPRVNKQVDERDL